MKLPVGSIILWSSGSIPNGWQLCDGTNGTPDLRGYFVVGANNELDLLTSGGSEVHVHANTSTDSAYSHNHTVSGTTGGANMDTATIVGTGSNASGAGHTHDFSGNSSTRAVHTHTLSDTGESNHLPPYISLYFIMKIE